MNINIDFVRPHLYDKDGKFYWEFQNAECCFIQSDKDIFTNAYKALKQDNNKMREIASDICNKLNEDTDLKNKLINDYVDLYAMFDDISNEDIDFLKNIVFKNVDFFKSFDDIYFESDTDAECNSIDDFCKHFFITLYSKQNRNISAQFEIINDDGEKCVNLNTLWTHIPIFDGNSKEEIAMKTYLSLI